MVVTKEWLDAHRGLGGAWTSLQLKALGVKWPPTAGWRDRLYGTEISEEQAAIFIAGKHKLSKSTLRRKDKQADKAVKIAALEAKVRRGSNWSSKANAPEFLQSYDWRRVRMEALKKHGARCQCCGASAENGIMLCVDHIKPRRFFPHLALDVDNLQILCEPCNHGKGNWDQTDWRHDEIEPETKAFLRDIARNG